MYGKFFVIFAIMLTGYILRKLKIIDEGMNNGINRFIVYFAYPCVIIHNIGTLEMSKALFLDFLFMFVLAFAFFMVYSGLAFGYCKLRHFPAEASNVAEFSMVCSNNGFMGFPVTLLFFGEKGLLLMLAHNAAMNFYFFTYGLMLMRRNDPNRVKVGVKGIFVQLAKLILNPNITALLVALFLCANKIAIPEVVDEYLLYIGGVSTPMAMIFIGSTLAGCSFLEIIRDRIVIETTLGKLLWLPVITYGLTLILPVSPLISAMMVLGCCFPAAATVSMIAEQEGQDIELCSKILFLSTVFSMVTLPVSIQLVSQYIL